MTDKDKEEIGKIVAEAMTSVLAVHPLVCPHGIDADTAAALRAIAKAVRDGKKITFKVIVTTIVMGVITAIGAGLRYIIIHHQP